MRSASPDESGSPSSDAGNNTSPTVCQLCRQRKTKCDRTLPRCGFCVKAKVGCQYVARPKKRGLRAGYVSQLENRIESLEDAISKLRQEHTRTSSSSVGTPGFANITSYATPGPERTAPTSTPLPATTPEISGSRSMASPGLAGPGPGPGPPASSPSHAGLDPTTSIFSPTNEYPTSEAPAATSISATSNYDHPPPKRRRLRLQSDSSDAAEADLRSLPRGYMYTLADLWFKETQPWMPILSQTSIQRALDALPDPVVTHIDDVVLKAVIALQVAYSSQAICIGYHGRTRLSRYLRAQVLDEALGKASLRSLQALLIIAVLDYGCDNIPSTFSLLSVCRRMCENIGLFGRLLNQMELQSPAQVGPPPTANMIHVNVAQPGGTLVDDDLAAIPLTWVTLAMDAVSTLGISWRDVSAALVDHLSSIAYVSTPDLRDSFRSHIHLAAIGLQPLHTFLHEHELGRYDDRHHEALATCDEIYHNLMTYVRAQPTTSYTLLADGLIDFDPNLVLTSILSHASVIISYSRLVEFEEDEKENDKGGADSGVPLQRCLQACEDVAMALRTISDADAELNTPLLAGLVFVAARFKLVRYQRQADRKPDHGREPIFDTLMHGINMCGRRWAVARRLDIVLRAAIVEVDDRTPFSESSLPRDFWDVRKSHLDISETLKDWVEGYKHSLYVGALNGPYM